MSASGKDQGVEEWMKGYEEGDDDSQVCLLLGRRVDACEWEVMDDIDRYIMKEMVTWWQRRKVLLGWVNLLSPCPLLSSSLAIINYMSCMVVVFMYHQVIYVCHLKNLPCTCTVMALTSSTHSNLCQLPW